MLFGIAALYFGFVADGWLGTAAFFVAVAAPMLATIRQRQGLALAVDYLVRVYLREAPAAMPAAGYARVLTRLNPHDQPSQIRCGRDVVGQTECGPPRRLRSRRNKLLLSLDVWVTFVLLRRSRA
jgi:hypothetical protein